MTHKHNGGPAFPLSIPSLECRARFESGYGGISVRDYFAAKAMAGVVASPDYVEEEWFQEYIARQAYQMADAMFAAREIK